MSSLSFEPLQERHLPEILEIEKVSQSAPWSERSFRNEFSNPQSLFLVALEKGKVVGFGGIWIVVDEAHVTTIAVDPAFRGKGIGKKLMDALLRHSVERGAVCSTLEVRASNEPAVKLYEKLGYQQVAMRKRYYPDNKEDAIVMWRYDLEPWI